VGGKTAVNHPGGKNLIGAFYQPKVVIADLDTLSTLPDRQLRAGFAEVLKYGVIFDGDFFQWLADHVDALLDRDLDSLAHAVERSCQIKAEVVAQDERETGIRAILNFGHTFGHALEALTQYSELLHGEAVAIGIVMAADLSARQGLLSVDEAQKIKALVRAFALPVAGPAVVIEEMQKMMGMDKKVVDGTLRLVLTPAIGAALVTEEIDSSALRATLAAGEALCDG
jgi:3-dehydroquinate synthase